MVLFNTNHLLIICAVLSIERLVKSVALYPKSVIVLKSTTDNVDTILDVANTDTFTDWMTDDEITDFGDYINPNYSATQLTVSEDADSGLFISEELAVAVHELHTINEEEVD